MAASPIPISRLPVAPIFRGQSIQERRLVRVIQPISGETLTAAVQASVAAATAAATAVVSGALAGKADNAAVAASLAQKASLGRRGINDANAVLSATDAYVAMAALTSARTITLPAAAEFPLGQPLYIADESGACSYDAGRTIAVSALGSDTIAGQSSVVMGSPYQKLTFHSNGSNLWTYA